MKTTVVAFTVDFTVGLVVLGIDFLAAAAILFILIVSMHPAGLLLTCGIVLVLSLVPWVGLVASGGTGFILLAACGMYLDAGAVYWIFDLFKVRSKKNTNENGKKVARGRPKLFSYHEQFVREVRTNRAPMIAICITIGVLAVPGGFLLQPQVAGSQHTFTISDEQASSYELFVYLPDFTIINDSVCQLLKDVNATVSFPLSEKNFKENDSRGMIAANRTALLNAYGVPVEVWPLFERDEGHYPSIGEIDRWPQLYQEFHNWTVRNNITVEYMMWDIESEGEGVDMSGIENWSEPFKTIGRYARSMYRLKQVNIIWQDALDTVRALGERCRADGHQMGTTTHTIIEDLFDGDADKQKLQGLPVWDAGAFDFISMMVYRGCEWGGTPATSDYVYDYVRLNAMVNPERVPVCLGCINYTPYPNITSVVNDVHLALAAGATMIRLFQANSWINGVGIWQNANGNWVYGGPAHGLAGLRELLEACRKGGTVTYVPTSSRKMAFLGSIVEDVLLDLALLP